MKKMKMVNLGKLGRDGEAEGAIETAAGRENLRQEMIVLKKSTER